MPTPTVSEIIEKAISENSKRIHQLWILILVLAITGIMVIIWGAFYLSYTAFVGLGATGLVLPAIRFMKQINDQNTALRLIQIPLQKSKTSEEAAKILV